MDSSIEVIEEFGKSIPIGEAGLSFPERVRLERAFFLLAKNIAERLGYSISGLNAPSKYLVDNIQVHDDQLDLKRLLVRLFEARSVLRNLASGESYIVDNLMGPSLPGRHNAVLGFSRSLLSIARIAKSTDVVE